MVSAPASVARKSPHLAVDTPRAYNTRLAAAKSPLGLTPGRTLHNTEDNVAKRRAMKEETDEVCSDIDENIGL